MKNEKQIWNFFPNFFFRRRKIKICKSSETRVAEVSRRSEPSLRGKRTFEVRRRRRSEPWVLESSKPRRYYKKQEVSKLGCRWSAMTLSSKVFRCTPDNLIRLVWMVRTRFWRQKKPSSSKIDRKWWKTEKKIRKNVRKKKILASKNRNLQIVWNARCQSFAPIGAKFEG